MRICKKSVKKPISLAGCIETCKKADIPEEEYSQWGIYEMFEKAEILAKEQNLECTEVFIDLSK